VNPTTNIKDVLSALNIMNIQPIIAKNYSFLEKYLGRVFGK
jgi:hypothetical protein